MHNILYLHEAARISGAENSLLNLAVRLDRRKFRPVFICPGSGEFADKLRIAGIKVCHLDFPRVRGMVGVFPAMNRIKSVIREEKISLLHSNSIRAHIYAALSARAFGLPVVWHQRNMLSGEIIDPDRLFSFLPSLIICNSQAVARRFLRKGKLPPNVRVVYNGVDTAKFSPDIDGRAVREEFGIGSDQAVVGMASRFNAIKGHETFLEAVKIVLKQCADIRDKLKFLVVGGAVFDEDRKRERYLRALTSRMGLGENVIFAGFREDMPSVYAAMDIFVLASSAEACGRVLLEAMACAKPVIATNSGGSPEIVMDGTTGYLFEPNDALSLAKKITALLRDNDEAKRMGQAGSKRVIESFSIERNVIETEKVYFQLLGC